MTSRRRAADLSRFSALSGQRLSGALEAGLSGSTEALSGAFDIRLAGTAQDLRADPAVPAALLAGETRLDLQASRDTGGVRIDALTVDGTQIALDASGDLSSQGGGLSATARLANLGLFTSAVSGPASITAEIASATEGWTVDATLDGPGGIRAQTDGRVGLSGGRVDLRAVGSLPLALANQFIAPRSVNGQLSFDLGVQGEPGLNAVSGRLSTSGARLVAPDVPHRPRRCRARRVAQRWAARPRWGRRRILRGPHRAGRAGSISAVRACRAGST